MPQVFGQTPDGPDMARLLRAARAFGRPKYLITDKGGQFVAGVFLKAARRLGAQHRFAATDSILATARLERSGERSRRRPLSTASTSPSPALSAKRATSDPAPGLSLLHLGPPFHPRRRFRRHVKLHCRPSRAPSNCRCRPTHHDTRGGDAHAARERRATVARPVRGHRPHLERRAARGLRRRHDLELVRRRGPGVPPRLHIPPAVRKV